MTGVGNEWKVKAYKEERKKRRWGEKSWTKKKDIDKADS